MTGSFIAGNNHWHRLRWQAFWGAVAAAIPPAMHLVVFGLSNLGQGLNSAINAFWSGLAAIFLGVLLIRNVGRYPGVERASAIIPGFSVSFGILIVLLLMLRLDYSRAVLAGSYVCAITIFYLGYLQVFGRKPLTIGVLPLKDSARGLLEIEGVQWVTLDCSDDPPPGIEAVAVDLRVELPDPWEQRIADFALSGLPVYHSKHLIESLTGRVELEHLSETNFGTLSPPDAYVVLKLIIDRVTAGAALLLLAPPLLIVAILIRLDSPGPAIFRQQRIGFRGIPFVVYKFRTMRTKLAEEAGTRSDAITRTNDDRITRIGKFLRRTRIDELPQIINILRGEMSWIGPRPEAAVLSKWYEGEIPFYRYRHIVRPGVTGWAQIMQGHVANVDEVRSKLYYDFYYIKNFSLWIDSLIVFRTLTIMLTGFGAK